MQLGTFFPVGISRSDVTIQWRMNGGKCLMGEETGPNEQRFNRAGHILWEEHAAL